MDAIIEYFLILDHEGKPLFGKIFGNQNNVNMDLPNDFIFQTAMARVSKNLYGKSISLTYIGTDYYLTKKGSKIIVIGFETDKSIKNQLRMYINELFKSENFNKVINKYKIKLDDLELNGDSLFYILTDELSKIIDTDINLTFSMTPQVEENSPIDTTV